MSSRSQRYLRLSCPRSATLCPRAAVFPSWGVLDFGAVWQASMRCHFWVNGRNSPPLACSSSAYTPVAVQQNSPPWLHHLGPHLTRRLGTSVQPWRYPHASGGEGRDGERGERVISGEWVISVAWLLKPEARISKWQDPEMPNDECSWISLFHNLHQETILMVYIKCNLTKNT